MAISTLSFRQGTTSGRSVNGSPTTSLRSAARGPSFSYFIGIMAAWIVLNTVVLQRLIHHQAFDPFPYIALNLVLSALAGL